MAISKKKPIVNPMVIFREESNGSAILLDTDSDKTYALNPVSAYIWNMLNGNNTKEIIIAALRQECEGGISGNTAEELDSFIEDLEENGLINYKE
jgi:hypothetical protein